MATCPRCGRENEDDVRFCGRCGLDLPRYTPQAAPPDAPAARCYRHPKVETNLSCGRCERPVCTRCAINGPAGIRCPDCARHNVAIRPGAIVHGAKRSLFSFGRMGPYGFYILLAIASMAFGAFRACGRDDDPPPDLSPSPAPLSEDAPRGDGAPRARG